MRKLCFLSVLFVFSCFATNDAYVSGESSQLKKYDQLVSKMGDYSLVDVRPEVGVSGTSGGYHLEVCYFGLSDYVNFIGNEGAIRSSNTNLLEFIFSNRLHCVRCVNNEDDIFGLDAFDNDECKDFFSQNDGSDLMKTLKMQSNCTYEVLVKAQELLYVERYANKLVIKNTASSSVGSLFSKMMTLNSCLRFYVFDSDGNVCGTVGITPHAIAKSEVCIGGQYVEAYPFIPSTAVSIDWFLFEEYRGKGVTRSVFTEVLRIIFGDNKRSTLVDAIELNIAPTIVASLKIAYGYGFQTLGEAYPNYDAAKQDNANYILKRGDYFRYKDKILAGNHQISSGIAERIRNAEKKISDAEGNMSMMDDGRKSLKRTGEDLVQTSNKAPRKSD